MEGTTLDGFGHLVKDVALLNTIDKARLTCGKLCNIIKSVMEDITLSIARALMAGGTICSSVAFFMKFHAVVKKHDELSESADGLAFRCFIVLLASYLLFMSLM